MKTGSLRVACFLFRLYLAGLGASPGWISKMGKPGAIAQRLDSTRAFVLYLADFGASPGWISKSRSRTEAYFCRHGPLTGWF